MRAFAEADAPEQFPRSSRVASSRRPAMSAGKSTFSSADNEAAG